MADEGYIALNPKWREYEKLYWLKLGWKGRFGLAMTGSIRRFLSVKRKWWDSKDKDNGRALE
jgi:hypothetical protein